MGNVREINVHECDIIHKIRKNLYREHFHAYGIGFMRLCHDNVKVTCTAILSGKTFRASAEHS